MTSPHLNYITRDSLSYFYSLSFRTVIYHNQVLFTATTRPFDNTLRTRNSISQCETEKMSTRYNYQSPSLSRRASIRTISDTFIERDGPKHSKSAIGSTILGAAIGGYVGRANRGDKLTWLTAAAVGAFGMRKASKNIKKRKLAKEKK
ncbi:hypothetical protein EJ08DRAFT_333992 [Tothia fuscella]|uniref:Glycine zipper 2TM domain-containing protein n=1 Tax=Tothia fuscella TaxID=1048955 RepID=A0A9P4P127_9PEZI|nr:hypothetical protein EJ08DRAFT_333992 [Tothia fuscella]